MTCAQRVPICGNINLLYKFKLCHLFVICCICHYCLSPTLPSIFHQSSTIGLVTLNEMKAKQEDVVKEREKKLARKQRDEERKRKKEIEAKNEQKRKEKQKVSFGHV